MLNLSAPTAEILLIGKPVDNLRLLSVMLSESGYKVVKAETGQEAIATATAKTPDLILLDLILPDLNSYEVCRRLKEVPELVATPVVFVSDPPDALDIDRLFAVGGADSIAPPFQQSAVIARIRDRLTLRWQKQQLHYQNRRLQAEIQERQNVEDTLYVYLHAISTELRHPMAAMATMLQHWQENGLPENLDRAIAQLSQRCDRQLQRLDHLMEVDELEVWGTTLDCQGVNLFEFVQNLEYQWQPLFAKFPVHFHNAIAPNCPEVNADPQQLERVFHDLIDNALQHNHPPLNLEIAVIKNDGKFLTCTVSDDGCGMDESTRDRVFSGDRPVLVGSIPGLGLGLYLCQQIIQAHGGKMSYLATPQGGTTICFTLPIVSLSS